MTMMDRVKGMSRKKKLAIAAILILAIGGTGTAVYANNQSQQKLTEAQAVVDKEYSTLKGLEKEIQALFDEKDASFLATGVTADQIKELKIEVATAANNYFSMDVDFKKLDTKDFISEMTTAEEQLAIASEKLALQEAVNGLFSEKDKIALKGSTVTKDLAIVDNLDDKVIESVKELSDDADESTFDQAILDLIAAAEGQLRQIETATTSVQKVYKGGKVVSTETKLYDAAKKEVDKIKNVKAKKTLSDQLEKVKAAIDKKAQDAKAAEEKAKAEAETQATAEVQAQQATEQAAGAQVAADQATTYDQAAVAADTGYAASGNTGTQAAAAVSGNTATESAPSQTAQTPSTGTGNGQTVMTQEEMNQAAQDASNMDPTQDPNSPWYNK